MTLGVTKLTTVLNIQDKMRQLPLKWRVLDR
jgi:hypothetical protein